MAEESKGNTGDVEEELGVKEQQALEEYLEQVKRPLDLTKVTEAELAQSDDPVCTWFYNNAPIGYWGGLRLDGLLMKRPMHRTYPTLVYHQGFDNPFTVLTEVQGELHKRAERTHDGYHEIVYECEKRIFVKRENYHPSREYLNPRNNKRPRSDSDVVVIE